MNYLEQMTDLSYFLKEINKKSIEVSNTDNELLDVVIIREEFRSKIDNLWRNFDKGIGKHNAHIIVFAIVAFIDEKMSGIIEYHDNTWPKFQTELFDIDYAGEKFYKLLDSVLSDPSYPKLVYYAFYLILKFGFEGELVDDAKKTKSYYLGMLEEVVSANINKNPDNDIKPVITNYKWKYYFSKYYVLLVLAILFITYLSTAYILTI